VSLAVQIYLVNGVSDVDVDVEQSNRFDARYRWEYVRLAIAHLAC
jgi:hypothetical protein